MAININTGFHVGAALPIDDRAYLTKAQMLAVDENIYPDYFLAVCADDGFLYMFDKNMEAGNVSAETGKFKLFSEDASGSEEATIELIKKHAYEGVYKVHEVEVVDDESGLPTGEKITVVDETIGAALDRLANDLTFVGVVEALPIEPKKGDLVNVVPAEGAEANAPKGWKFWDGAEWQSLSDATLSDRVAALEALHDTKTETVENTEVTSFKTVEEEIIEKAKNGIYKNATTESHYENADGKILTVEEYNTKVEASEDVTGFELKTTNIPAVTIEDAIKVLEEAADNTNGALVYKGEVATKNALPGGAKVGDLYHIVPAIDDAVTANEWVFLAEDGWKSFDSAIEERLAKLELQVGKDKEVNAYGEAADLVDIANVLTANVDTEGSVLNVIRETAADGIYDDGTPTTVTKLILHFVDNREFELTPEIIQSIKEGTPYELINGYNLRWNPYEYDGFVLYNGTDMSAPPGHDSWEIKEEAVAGHVITIREAIDNTKKDSVVTIFPITEGIEDNSILKKYTIYQGLDDVATPEEAKLIGTIDIPKDLVVTSGSVVELEKAEIPNPEYVDEITTPGVSATLEVAKIGEDIIAAGDVEDEASPYYGYPIVAGTYIKLVVANQKKPIFIDAKSLVDTGSLGSTTANVTANVEVGGVMAGDVIEEGTDIQKLVERLLIKYYPPTVTLTATPANKVVEVGESINVELTAAVTKKSLDVASVIFSDGTAAVDVAEGGSFSHEIVDPVTDTTTFSVTVSDGKKEVSSSVKYTFVNPYYTGVVNADAVNVDITTLGKKIEEKGKKKYSYEPRNQYVVFAYPASYGDLTSILDINGFEQLPSFDKTSVTVGTVAYTVYTTATPVSNDMTYTFA